jgi:hypothetical protein
MSQRRLVESRSSNDELAAAFVENRGGVETHKRITPYLLRFKSNGEPDFPYERETVIGAAEYEGMQNMRALAVDGHNFVVWASPEGGRSDYNDGNRLVVAVVKSRYEGVTMECRGIVLNEETPDQLLKMVRGLQGKGAVAMDEIRNPEDLREQAVALNVKNESELWDQLEEVFGHMDIWDVIRKDRDKLNKKMVEEMIARFRNSPESEIAKKSGDIWWGAQLEYFMARNGYQIMGGNHGVTNRSLLEKRTSAFNKLFKASVLVSEESLNHNLKRCEKCGDCFIKSKKQCPSCFPKN